MVHRRELDGSVLVLGNQGALWGNAMTWWDHDTGSVWSQPLGEAIVGPRKGRRLELLASQLTRWDTWQGQHPATLALDAPGGSSRFELEDMAIVVDFGDEVAVFAVEDLIRSGPANVVVAGVPVAVAVDPTDPNLWKVLHRRIGDDLVTLAVSNDVVIDIETGSTWGLANGIARDGVFAGEILDSLPGFTAFERDARTFWPDARYWEG